jgi:hypothetical protein
MDAIELLKIKKSEDKLRKGGHNIKEKFVAICVLRLILTILL